MRPKKNGTRPIARESWTQGAALYEQMAGDLDWLVSCSLASLRHPPTSLDKFPELPVDSPLYLAVARVLAEGRVEAEEAEEGPGVEDRIGTELFCILDTIIRVAGEYRECAETYKRLARAVRRGMPKAKPINALSAVALGATLPGKSRPGPKLKVCISDEELMRKLDKARAKSGHITARKALEPIARNHLEMQGRAASDHRVREMVSNLEKCASALKNRNRKSTD